MCSRITTAADRVASLSLKFPKDGILALPKTYATKCQYGEDKSLVLSATFIQFAVNNVQDFGKVTASMLDNPAFLPLIAPMNTAIDQGIFTRTKNSTMAFFIKIPSSASDVDFFVCVSEYRTKQGNAGLICTYILTSFTLVKPQAMDPTISADVNRKPRPINSLNATNQLEFIVRHLPRTAKSQGTQNTAPLFSAEHLSQATVDATRYLASLGHNVHIYKNLGSTADDLYILYDTVELKDAYEISTTAFIIICALTALFVLVWYFTGRFCSAHYTNSLYMAIHQELSSKNKSVPMLMFCTHDPIAFDGNQVVPGSREDLSVDQVEPFSQEHSVDSPSEDCGDKPKKQQKWRLRTTSQKNIDQSSPRKPWSITIARPVEDYTVPTIIQTGPDSTNISMSLQAAEPQPHINIDQSNAPPIPRHSRPRQFPHNSLSTPSTQ
ncbi:hypothetical protein BGW41_000664 [Actinomortierella wolfii]|nr:hypothetical protein BGW41_000664 [Actinomortierella wolfii]